MVRLKLYLMERSNYELKIPEEKKYSKLNGGTINIYKVKNDGSSSFQTSTQTDFEAPQLYSQIE